MPCVRESMVEYVKDASASIFSVKGYPSVTVEPRLFSRRVIAIPPFIDVEQPKPKFLERSGLRNDEKRIICVARMDKSKGQNILIDEAAMLDLDYRLAFTGNNSFSNDVLRIKDEECYGKEHKKAKNDAYADRVTLAGTAHRNLLMVTYNGCDLVVLSSLHEGFGLAIVERRAFEKTAIETAVGGIPFQIWPEENGYLVRTDDPRSLSDAIRYNLKDSELAEKTGSDSKAIFERNFSSERVAEGHIGLYNRLLKLGA